MTAVRKKELSEAKQLQLIEHMEQQINKPKNHSIFMMRQVQYLNISSIGEVKVRCSKLECQKDIYILTTNRDQLWKMQLQGLG